MKTVTAELVKTDSCRHHDHGQRMITALAETVKQPG